MTFPALRSTCPGFSSRFIPVVALLVCGAACDTLPLLAPSDSTIDLTASQSTISFNGKAVIAAFVTEAAGTPVQNGTVVTFAATLGTLDANEARTLNGRASVGFSAGLIAGTTTITAFSGTAMSGDLSVSIVSASP